MQPKFGPMPSFPNQRIFARVVMILATLIIVYFTSKNEKEMIFAKQREMVPGRGQNVECSAEYTKELNDFPGMYRFVRFNLYFKLKANNRIEGL